MKQTTHSTLHGTPKIYIDTIYYMKIKYIQSVGVATDLIEIYTHNSWPRVYLMVHEIVQDLFVRLLCLARRRMKITFVDVYCRGKWWWMVIISIYIYSIYFAYASFRNDDDWRLLIDCMCVVFARIISHSYYMVIMFTILWIWLELKIKKWKLLIAVLFELWTCQNGFLLLGKTAEYSELFNGSR